MNKILQVAQDYAKSHNGSLITTEYVSTKTKMEWKCQNENHPSWFAPISIASSKNKRWCWKCYIKVA